MTWFKAYDKTRRKGSDGDRTLRDANPSSRPMPSSSHLSADVLDVRKQRRWGWDTRPSKWRHFPCLARPRVIQSAGRVSANQLWEDQSDAGRTHKRTETDPSYPLVYFTLAAFTNSTTDRRHTANACARHFSTCPDYIKMSVLKRTVFALVAPSWLLLL